MAPRLVILGAGGHGAEVQTYVHDLSAEGWNGSLLGFLDDGLPPGQHLGLSVLGGIDEFVDRSPEFFADLFYLTAVGSNPARRKLVERMDGLYRGRIRPWTLIHATVWKGAEVSIGDGTCVAPGAIVTTRARIGRHCILNVKASVSHDCVLGDYVNLNPGATVCGNVTIGDGAYIGTGATLINKVSVGRNAIIGAGAVVVRDIPDSVTAVGVPARVIKRHG